MKEKNGFTLIELLAIIVILAIIAVITVPIVLDVIEGASKKSVINSAYGYKDSIIKGNVLGAATNDYEETKTGTFVMMENGNMTDKSSNVLIAEVTGNYPEEGSWVELDNGEVIAYSLKFGDYVVTKCGSGNPEAVKDGEIEICYLYWDKDNSGTVNLGDYVKIGPDGFYVIAAPENGEVKLLAEYNLDSNSKQTSGTYSKFYFSAANNADDFWWNYSTDTPYDTYSKDIYNYAYVYRTSTGADTNNNLKTYINNYKDYLINDLGADDIIDARAMSYAEAVGTGCGAEIENSCPSYLANQHYWLGSVKYRNFVWGINGREHYLYNFFDGALFTLGIRPLIIIPESSISM